MKDRVREAMFNLIGPAVRDKLAIDLFAGTGAIGLEAISRGASTAVLLEQHFPSADIIRQNAALLGIEADVKVIAGSTFTWLRRGQVAELSTSSPWLVFCSPPYSFYLDRLGEMIWLTKSLCNAAPGGSLFIAESDQRFDFSAFSEHGEWNVRDYPPARLGILQLSTQ